MIAFLLAGLSVLPWSIALIYLFPIKNYKKTVLILVLSLLAGHTTTEILLWAHPIIWPEATAKITKHTHILTQTIHIAFIQAGMLEETTKIFFILLLAFFLAHKNKIWEKEVVLIGSFVAIGFSLSENTSYFYSAKDDALFMTFIGRTVHSVNIHMLINLCFALFLLKSNENKNKLLVPFAIVLAVIQHGVVDFFLLPSAKIGNWLAAAMFAGIWVWVVKDFRKYVIQLKQ